RCLLDGVGYEDTFPESSIGFAARQFAFALHAPTVAANITVAPQHPVARNGHGDGVRTASVGHGPYRLWRTDAFGNLGIADRGTRRHLTQGLPDTLLERRPTPVQRQVKSVGPPLHQSHDLSKP